MKPNTADVIEVRSDDGAGVSIHLQGAHVLSWYPARGKQQLYLSGASLFEEGVAIRGGVPVVFPQFSGRGPLAKHGFARNLRWSVQEQSAGRVLLQLRDSDVTRAQWPHSFILQLEVKIAGQELHMTLRVENTGDTAFTFTTALHTYLALPEVTETRLTGLTGFNYTDNTNSKTLGDAEPAVTFGTDVDRLYHWAGGQSVQVGNHIITQSGGFHDTVVWNPGPVTGSKIADLDQPDGWRKYVCVEAAEVVTPVTLPPQQTWSGAQHLLAQ